MGKFEKLEQLVKTVKEQEEIGLSKAKDILGEVKSIDLDIPDFFKSEEPVVEEKGCKCDCKCKKWIWIAAIVVGVILVAALIYGLYRYFTPDYLDDFDEDFDDDDFEDDFFEDDDAQKRSVVDKEDK